MKKHKKVRTMRFPFGADITKVYIRPEDFKPMLAVLCPLCASGFAPYRAKYWQRQALGGEKISAGQYDSLYACCEACRESSERWSVPEYFRTKDGDFIWLDDGGQYRNENGGLVNNNKNKDGFDVQPNIPLRGDKKCWPKAARQGRK